MIHTRLTLQELEGSLGRLPSMPAVVARLLRGLEDPGLDVRQLAEDIAQDQALAAKTLRIANSPFYGLRGRVVTLHDAVVVLGLHTVRTLTLAAAASGILGQLRAEGFDTAGFWRHSTAAAVLARALAGRTRANPESAFIVGLLHDIGRLVIAANFPVHYRNVRECAEREGIALRDAEGRCLGIDHLQVGELLGRRWGFPASIVEGIAGHHAPEAWPEQPLAAVASLADSAAHELEGDAAGAGGPPRSDYAWQLLGLDEDIWAGMLRESREKAAEFLRVLAE